ncbi:MAG: serine/threonine-protein kinase [Myxococcota bacterium]
MEAGTRVGSFEVVQPLARGGMAAVYLVARSGPGGFRRYAAMKIVRPDLVRSDEFRTMFLDEARVAARIRHPNVIHIEDLGEANGTLFLVMEYVPGASLSTLLRGLNGMGRVLKAEMAIALAVRLATGLHAAHETRDEAGQRLNVVHRDVSPQNVILGVHGDVKLIDFGIASARDRLHETGHNIVRGKLRYMAPEQLQGLEVDRRADLFSLGIVMWEMLTMRRLFQSRDDNEVIRAILKGELPSPMEFAPIPGDVNELVKRLLAPEPSDRPATAREVTQELKKFMPEAFLIEDVDIAGLLWGVAGQELASLPDFEASQALNTTEMKTVPRKALEDFTRPVTRFPIDDKTIPGVPWSQVTGDSTGTAVSAAVMQSLTASEPDHPSKRVSKPERVSFTPAVTTDPIGITTDPIGAPPPSKNGIRLVLAILMALMGAAIGYLLVHFFVNPQVEEAAGDAEEEIGAGQDDGMAYDLDQE